MKSLLLAALLLFAPAATAQPATTTPQIHADLTPGHVIFEGDIQIRISDYLLIQSGHGDALFGSVPFWPNGIVPFDFVTSGQGAVTPANQTLAINAMNDIAGRSGVLFTPANAQSTNRIRFQNSNSNNSPVGCIGGTQIINIVSWGNHIIICHEIFHSLGFWHEQSRFDRSPYITINADNICGSISSPACTAGSNPPNCCLCPGIFGGCDPCGSNFDVRPSAVYWGPYDFDSFMHYGRTAFSCNGQDTITCNPGYTQWQNVIGQRDHFSNLDTLSCRGVYPRTGDRWLRIGGLPANAGNFFFPYGVFTVAHAGTPTSGTLFVDPGNYPGSTGTYSRPMTIRGTYGTAVIGN